MSLLLEHLNLPDVRHAMFEEVVFDISHDRIYFSPRLSDDGRRRWSEILSVAVQTGDPISLRQTIETEGLLSEYETYQRDGVVRQRKVAINAAEMLADGEFNRFYLRGLAGVAINGGNRLEVYRAKSVSKARPESEALIGTSVAPEILLRDLRENIGVDLALGIPAGPNSGLSCRLI